MVLYIIAKSGFIGRLVTQNAYNLVFLPFRRTTTSCINVVHEFSLPVLWRRWVTLEGLS